MTIYEVLERLIIGPTFRTDEEAAAVAVIRQLRDTNALGTVAGITDLASHECRAGTGYWPDTGRCVTCLAPMPVPPHECSPITRWTGSSWDIHGGKQETTCRICGRGM